MRIVDSCESGKTVRAVGETAGGCRGVGEGAETG